jgi:hypothetical protein
MAIFMQIFKEFRWWMLPVALMLVVLLVGIFVAVDSPVLLPHEYTAGP